MDACGPRSSHQRLYGLPPKDPRRKECFVQGVQAEQSPALRSCLFRVPSHDLQIGLRSKRDQSVTGPVVRVTTSDHRPDTEQLMNLVDAGLQIGDRIDQMVHALGDVRQC